MSNEIQQHDLVISRVFAAPLAQVWNAWTDAQYVMQWWGPDGFTCPIAQMDVREGGTTLLAMHSPEYGEHYSIWQYRKIVPLQLLEFIHNLADKDGNRVDPISVGMPPDFPQDQHQTVVFKAIDPTQTRITITEYGWTVGDMMEMSRMGMEQCLDKMAAIFAR